MADMTDGERIAEERIAEAARTGQDWLDLSGLGLTRLPDRLADLTSLRRLSIGRRHRLTERRTRIGYGFQYRANVITSISCLSSLDNLLQLYMDGTSCSDLRPLTGLKWLQHLNCSFTPVNNLIGLEKLSNLQRLDCGDTQVSDLAPLGGLKHLRHLNCSNTQVRDLKPLLWSQSLRVFDCGNSPVRDLKPLSYTTNLINLDCSGTEVRDLSPIAGLKQLSYLNCGSTRIKDLSPIAELHKLKRLHCDGTKVRDLSPVVKLHNLTHLTAENCEISYLPPEVEQLHSLVLLDLEKNGLRTLPKQLGYLRNLEAAFKLNRLSYPLVGLLLKNNPLADPLPKLIAHEQPEATINVLRWLRNEPIETEAKEPDPPAPEERADDPPVIPEQGAGPRVVLDQTGRLVFAKPSDLDAKGNDRNRLEALHPALREAAADLAKALQDHTSNLRNERLLQKAEAYRALVDLPLDEVNFARLYGAGMQLLNAAAATREALEASRVDVPDLTPLQNECLKNIEGLHPPFVLASRDGQEMLADQTTIKLTADHVLAVKEAGTAFGEALLHRPDLAAPGIGQTIKDAAAEIGQGGNPAREAVNAVSSARNTVVVAAWIATAASLTVGGAAYYGSPGAVLGMIPGVLLIESVKSSAIFKDITKRGAKTIDWSDEKIAALGARIKHWQELLGQNDGHLRKLAQVPKFEWLGPVIDWLKRNSPPDKKG